MFYRSSDRDLEMASLKRSLNQNKHSYGNSHRAKRRKRRKKPNQTRSRKVISYKLPNYEFR